MSQRRESKKEMRPHGSIASWHTSTETPSPYIFVFYWNCQTKPLKFTFFSSALKKIDEMKTSFRRVYNLPLLI